MNVVIYDIYQVEGTALYRGDTPATAAKNRPVTLENTATASYSGDIPEI